ncbi:hypothetical protein GGI21_000972 [Coemansia aciculifera]|uniref:Uncharacterized protein n=1 Tax=Coemansia aciculifera TaxID=417176 RepID=A0ACC1LY43_9FUNG|nr:hypothetical protein IWW38_004398 [Coemansia aciculifera]KAJ2910336.1 hypothetical protein GGI21_000972 [Coemansia aciculifera]
MQLVNMSITLTAALVAMQNLVIASAVPDNDMRAGAPLQLNTACPNAQGQFMCANSSALLVCDHSYWRFLSNCPEGTKCQNNQCINAAEYTTPASQPVSSPTKPPVLPVVPPPTPVSRMSSSTTTTSQSSIPNIIEVSKFPDGPTTTTSVSSSSIPNIVQVPKLPIMVSTTSKSSKTSKPTEISNISKVTELPIESKESLASSAASKSSWTRLNVVVPVVSAIVAPYVIMLLF